MIGIRTGYALLALAAFGQAALGTDFGRLDVLVFAEHEKEIQEPLFGARILLSSPTGQQYHMLTDLHGVASFDVLPGKNYRLRVLSAEYEPFEQGNLTITAGFTTSVRVKLHADLHDAATLRVHVTTQRRSKRATKADGYVEVRTTDGARAWRAYDSKTEWIEFHLPASETYHLTVKRRGFATVRVDHIKLRRSGPVSLSVVLVPDQEPAR